MNKSVAAAIVGVVAVIIVLVVVLVPSDEPDRPDVIKSDTDVPASFQPPDPGVLGTAPEEPKAFLLWAAAEPRSQIEIEAIEAIGSLEGPWTDEFLAKALVTDEDDEYEDEEVTGAALVALARRGTGNLLPDLRRLFVQSDEDWDTDALIAAALGLIPGPDSRDLLISMVNREDPDEDVLVVVIRALASHPGEESRDAIKSLLDHEEENVQATAAAVLLRSGDPDAVRLVATHTADIEDSDWDMDVLATALGEPGSEAAVPVLVRLAASEDWDTRLLALRSLGRTGLPAAQEAVKAAIEDEDEDVRTTAAATLLRDFGDLSGVKVLEEAIDKSRDYEVVMEAVRGLALLSREEDRARFQAIFDRKIQRLSMLVARLWAAHALLRTPK